MRILLYRPHHYRKIMKVFKLFTGLLIFICIFEYGVLFARLQPSFGLLFHLSSVV